MAKLRFAKKNKKGLTQSQVVGLIAALALGILLLQFTKPFISAVQAQDIIEACRLSVGLSSWQLDVNTFVFDKTIVDSPFTLDCKTLFTEITKDSINRADDKIKLSDEPAVMKEQLKEAIMRNMRECWYMYGEGKVKIHQAGIIKGEGETSCLVCSEIIATKEFIDLPITKELDNMYSYAANTPIPPKDEKDYLSYFLEGATPRPAVTPADIDKDKEAKDHGVVFDNDHRQYSVIFAITSKEDEDSAGEKVVKFVFGRESTANANAGIVDCYVGGVGKVTKDEAKEIGCKPDGTSPNSLIFGKVIDGGTDVDLINWKTLGAAGVSPVAAAVLGPISTLKTYPATVRLVPTSELKSYCKRLY